MTHNMSGGKVENTKSTIGGPIPATLTATAVVVTNQKRPRYTMNLVKRLKILRHECSSINNNPNESIEVCETSDKQHQHHPGVQQRPVSLPVRRNLFGPVDHEKLAKDIKDEMDSIMVEKKRKWGFDFELDRPCEGVEQTSEITIKSSNIVPAAAVTQLADMSIKDSRSDKEVQGHDFIWTKTIQETSEQNDSIIRYGVNNDNESTTAFKDTTTTDCLKHFERSLSFDEHMYNINGTCSVDHHDTFQHQYHVEAHSDIKNSTEEAINTCSRGSSSANILHNNKRSSKNQQKQKKLSDYQFSKVKRSKFITDHSTTPCYHHHCSSSLGSINSTASSQDYIYDSYQDSTSNSTPVSNSSDIDDSGIVHDINWVSQDHSGCSTKKKIARKMGNMNNTSFKCKKLHLDPTSDDMDYDNNNSKDMYQESSNSVTDCRLSLDDSLVDDSGIFVQDSSVSFTACGGTKPNQTSSRRGKPKNLGYPSVRDMLHQTKKSCCKEYQVDREKVKRLFKPSSRISHRVFRP